MDYAKMHLCGTSLYTAEQLDKWWIHAGLVGDRISKMLRRPEEEVSAYMPDYYANVVRAERCQKRTNGKALFKLSFYHDESRPFKALEV